MFWFGFYPPLWFGAGMDKRAEALRGWESVGLAFAEIGGVTMLEQGAIPNLVCFAMVVIGLSSIEWASTILAVRR